MSWPDDSELDSAVFDGKTLDFEEQGPDGVNPWRLVDQQIERSNHSRFLVTDSGDSDGLGCATLFHNKFDGDVTLLPASHRNWGYDPLKVLSFVEHAGSGDEDVYITDLGQSEETEDEWFLAIAKLVDAGHDVYLRDHHDNSSEIVGKLNDLHKVEYIHNQDMCATKIVHENDYPDAPEHIADLAELTDVRDMFRTDHPRFEESEILSNAAFWFPFKYYIETASEHGTDLTNDPEWGDYIEKRTQFKEAKLQRALENHITVERDGINFGFVFGDCYQSEAGRRLLEEKGCDVAVIAKPSGKLSFRTSEEYPIANQIAEAFGGGGHECAAGAGDEFDGFDLRADDPIPSVRNDIIEQTLSVC